MGLEKRVSTLEKELNELKQQLGEPPQSKQLNLVTAIIKTLDQDREKNLKQIMANLDEHFRERFDGY